MTTDSRPFGSGSPQVSPDRPEEAGGPPPGHAVDRDLQPQPFSVLGIETDGRWRAILRGELDLAGVPGLTDLLFGMRPEDIDLTTLTFLDARGLAALLAAQHELRQTGAPCRIVGATGVVRRVFEITGLTDRLDD